MFKFTWRKHFVRMKLSEDMFCVWSLLLMNCKANVANREAYRHQFSIHDTWFLNASIISHILKESVIEAWFVPVSVIESMASEPFGISTGGVTSVSVSISVGGEASSTFVPLKLMCLLNHTEPALNHILNCWLLQVYLIVNHVQCVLSSQKLQIYTAAWERGLTNTKMVRFIF